MKEPLVILFLVVQSCNGKKSNDSDTQKVYYSSGELKSVTKYANDDSTVISYSKNGNISSRASYHNGKFIGIVNFYYSNGMKNFEGNYDSVGRANGMVQLWYENGKIKQTGKNEAGKMIDEWKSFFDNGELESVGSYKENKKDGLWIYYKPNGDTLKKETFKDGISISD